MTTQTKQPATDGHNAKAQAASLVQDAAPSMQAADLAQIIQAYNQATDKLQHSHEALQREVVRLRKELASADAQLQRSKRLSALGEMAAGIAHEVRNPLAAIQLYATMIVQDLDGQAEFAEPARCAGEISSAVRGLEGIVGDVLSFAREMKPSPTEWPVCEIFERVVAAHGPAIEAAGVTVCNRIDDQCPHTVFADVDLLHRALLNLVRNAVDAMGECDGTRELTLDARVDADGATLCVRDTGPGIDKDVVDRLFNPFFTTRATGTGLGLAIVHRIVDAHGGSINVCENNHAGPGAVFELNFPAQPATPANTQVRETVGASA